MSVLVYESAETVELDGLEDELARAFSIIRAALARGDVVVVALDEHAVEGGGDPVRAALAHGLLGLVRALATEGRNAGWQINALATPRGLDGEARLAWIDRLAEPAGASGTLIRLGTDHLGKVPA